MNEGNYKLRGKTVRYFDVDDVRVSHVEGESWLQLYAADCYGDESVRLTVEQAQQVCGAITRMLAEIAVEQAR